MKDGQSVRLGRSSDREVEILPTALVLFGKQALNNAGALHMFGRRPYQDHDIEGSGQGVPLDKAASCETDL